MQEGEQHGNIAVLSGRGDHVQVAVLDVGEGAVIGLDQRPGQGLVLNLVDQA